MNQLCSETPAVSPVRAALVGGFGMAWVTFLMLAPSPWNNLHAQIPPQASAASADIATAVRRIDCEGLEATVKAQAWKAGGTPLGKPYEQWTNADFDTVNKYAAECTRVLQQRNVSQAGLLFVEINSFLTPIQSALARTERQRIEDARAAEWREQNRMLSEKKQAEMTQHQAKAEAIYKARRKAVEDRAELSAAQHVNDFKSLGVGPDLLSSTIFVDYVDAPKKILTLYHFLGLALSNPKLDKLNTRRWSIGEGDGNAIEVMYKLKGRPTQGLLFIIDGNDLFANFKVENDVPLQFKENYAGASLRSEMMREITGITEEEWGGFFF